MIFYNAHIVINLEIMNNINWNTEKSMALKESRAVCFEDVFFYIERGDILNDYIHPNQKTYPGQRSMVICIVNYAYLIPYVKDEEELFLKETFLSFREKQLRKVCHFRSMWQVSFISFLMVL
jgi:hypothetical protein